MKSAVLFCRLLLVVSTLVAVQAHSAPLKECSGLYTGKTYYIGDSKWSPPSEIRIVGIDKEEGKLTIEYTEGQLREKSNLEFESC